MYPQKYIMCRVTIFSLRKKRTGSLKIIACAEVQFSTQNEMKSKNKSSRPQKSKFLFFFALPIGAAGPKLGPN